MYRHRASQHASEANSNSIAQGSTGELCGGTERVLCEFAGNGILGSWTDWVEVHQAKPKAIERFVALVWVTDKAL